MVDRILKFGKENHTQEEIDKFQEKIINKKNARYIFLFAKYVSGANIRLLSENIIKLNNRKYIHFFIRSIKKIDYAFFISKILDYNDSNFIFYVAHDTKELPEKYLIDIAYKINELKDYEYLVRLLYYYFNVYKLKDEKMVSLAKDTFKKFNIEYSDNIYDSLEILRDITLKNYVINDYKSLGYTPSCYKGRKGYIPDIIVCHMTSDYIKAINIFHDKISEVSSHYIVSKTGESLQLVDLKDSAWANGTAIKNSKDTYYKFSTNRLIVDRKENANYYTFSIEHETLDGSLTEEQYATTLSLIKKIIKFLKEEYDYDFIIDREHIIGHREITPLTRVICPGDNFPFDRLINDLKNNK